MPLVTTWRASWFQHTVHHDKPMLAIECPCPRAAQFCWLALCVTGRARHVHQLCMPASSALYMPCSRGMRSCNARAFCQKSMLSTIIGLVEQHMRLSNGMSQLKSTRMSCASANHGIPCLVHGQVGVKGHSHRDKIHCAWKLARAGRTPTPSSPSIQACMQRRRPSKRLLAQSHCAWSGCCDSTKSSKSSRSACSAACTCSLRASPYAPSAVSRRNFATAWSRTAAFLSSSAIRAICRPNAWLRWKPLAADLHRACEPSQSESHVFLHAAPSKTASCLQHALEWPWHFPMSQATS